MIEDRVVGIKLADGEYFPVIQSHQETKKRLVLTTAMDSQSKVVLEFFEGQGPLFQNPIALGSIILENLPKLPQGNSNIRVILEIDSLKKLKIQAWAVGTEEKKTFIADLYSPKNKSQAIPNTHLDEKSEESKDFPKYHPVLVAIVTTLMLFLFGGFVWCSVYLFNLVKTPKIPLMLP